MTSTSLTVPLPAADVDMPTFVTQPPDALPALPEAEASGYPRLTLPQVSEADKRWQNTLALCETHGSVSVGGESLALAWDKTAQPPVSDYGICLQLSLAGEPCYLALTHWPLEALLANYCDANLLDTLPDALAVSVVNAAYGDLFAALEQASGAKINLISLSARPAERERLTTLEFIVRAAEAPPVHGQLAFSGNLRPFIGAMMRASACESTALEARVSVKARGWVGACRLQPEEVAGLGVGDVLLLPELQPEKPLFVRLTVEDTFLCVAHYRSGELSIVNTETEEPSVESADPQSPPIDGLSVTLDCDIGDLRLSVAELKDLKPGVVFDLKRRQDKLVHIRNNGTLLATGELVDIDGFVGVRVCQLAD
ncbi:MAG TPA: hypothetical protein DD979_15520 [Gammaproteobacteria bacterium]|jgi:type III secretion system YscQ/HrcQ family protein|nr:hypothetical protein [Gammaproteobacteria bacterium]